MSNFHKPVKRPGDIIEQLSGAGDPAELSLLAQDTAAALLSKVRRAPDQSAVDKVIAFADGEGIEELAELWSASSATSLPGALWRLYLLRHAVREAPSAAGYRFRRGLEVDAVGQAISGSVSAPSPEEVVDLATQILRGAFTGDFAVALDRAAAFARVMAGGSRELIASDPTSERREQEERRLLGYESLSAELTTAAGLWRSNNLH